MVSSGPGGSPSGKEKNTRPPKSAGSRLAFAWSLSPCSGSGDVTSSPYGRRVSRRRPGGFHGRPEHGLGGHAAPGAELIEDRVVRVTLDPHPTTAAGNGLYLPLHLAPVHASPG